MKPLFIATLGALLFMPRLGLAGTLICHLPPGDHPQAITVDVEAVSSHLAHGDCLGGCACMSISTCNPKAVDKVHGKHKDLIVGNARLGRIENGTVACLHAEDASKRDCVFTPGSGTWVETADGDFALAGQSISLDGSSGGEYVVASRVSVETTVPCVDPTSMDSVGTSAGTELAYACTMETLGASWNFNSGPLVNHATLEVCTSSNPHPDGATFTRMLGDSFCYIGAGAALNDIHGTERDEFGTYLGTRCHVIHTADYEMVGAKRPATTGTWPMTVKINTPILWRPVTTSVTIAN